MDVFAEKSPSCFILSSFPSELLITATVSTNQRCLAAAPGHEKSPIKHVTFPRSRNSVHSWEQVRWRRNTPSLGRVYKRKPWVFLPAVATELQVVADTFTQVTAKGALGRTARDGGVGIKSEVAIRYHFRLWLFRLKADGRVKSAASYYFRQIVKSKATYKLTCTILFLCCLCRICAFFQSSLWMQTFAAI